MSVRSGKVCNDCNHCIRDFALRNNYISMVYRCDVHDMYLSHESVNGGCCKHWEKPKAEEET